MRKQGSAVEPRCPIRLGEACSLCSPGATVPHDCGQVYLLMADPDLREELARMRAELREDLQEAS